MTDLQSKELELLKLFTEICDKLNLRYYLVCGSALGAVKYGGFIPWDDDIDVGLIRPDYERFLREAGEYLPDWAFLQNYKTDKAFPHIFTKLRDSRTTQIEEGLEHLPINHGMYIDILPLDGYPDSEKERKVLRYRKKFLSWKQVCALGDAKETKVKIRNKIFRLFGYHKKTDKTIAKIEKLISKYDVETSQIWCNHGNWQGEREYATREQYGEGAVMTFEGLRVIVPENYDAYLTQKYGDWRNDPPLDKQCSHHRYVVCDANKPYTDYIEKGKK